jgi:hypothetical protein
MIMLSIGDWNRQQLFVFQRYCRVHGVSLTPEMLAMLAQRFARKHADQRTYIDASTSPAPRHRAPRRTNGAASPLRLAALPLAGADFPSSRTTALPDEPLPSSRLSGLLPPSPVGAPLAPVASRLPLRSAREGLLNRSAQRAPAAPAGEPAALAGTYRWQDGEPPT